MLSTDEEQVLAANEAFYRAFAARDAAAMEAMWSKSAAVACIHPGWPALRGREQVMSAFRRVLGSSSAPAIRFSDATAHLLGDAAFVTCYETIPGSELVATNVFAREEGGTWRLVHHQAGPVARPESESNQTPKPDPSSLN